MFQRTILVKRRAEVLHRRCIYGTRNHMNLHINNPKRRDHRDGDGKGAPHRSEERLIQGCHTYDNGKPNRDPDDHFMGCEYSYRSRQFRETLKRGFVSGSIRGV